MSDIPSYYVWYPSLEKGKDVASILLSSGSRRRAPAGGRQFFEAVLAAAEIRAKLTAWGIEPFFSSYFTQKKWEESWNARLLIDEMVDGGSETKVEGIGLFVEPDTEAEPAESLPVRVIADFDRRRDLESCREELKERSANARWNEIHYERYIYRDIGDRRKQLLVDVTTRERPRLQEGIDAAEDVIAICRRHDGRTYSSVR